VDLQSINTEGKQHQGHPRMRAAGIPKTGGSATLSPQKPGSLTDLKKAMILHRNFWRAIP